MTPRSRLPPLLLLLGGLCLPVAASGPPLGVAEFAARTLDPYRLPSLGPEWVSMASSADITGDNNDWAHWVDTGRDEFVPLAEFQGPGFLSRFWVTGWADDHRLFRFLVDGEAKPALELTFQELFGGKAPFTPPWSRQENSCGYSYLPIPFQKSLRIEVKAGKPGGTFYFQANHTRLPPSARVRSFQWPLRGDDLQALKELELKWTVSPAVPVENPALAQRVDLAPDGTVNLPEIPGEGVIREIRLRPEGASADNPAVRARLLRDVVASFTWDGFRAPSVECPVGDLFGQVWRAGRYGSFSFGSDGAEWFLRFPMPFREGARLSFGNEGDKPQSFTLRVWTAGEPGPDDGYFHTGFQRTEPEDLGPEHPVLRVRGDGKYVGCLLSVVSQQESFWCLEGDETIRIDDEQIPGWRGTGLEDWFNGGWYYREIVANPLSGVLLKAPFKTVQYRLHTTDAPRFTKSIDVQVERGGQNNTPVWMESTSYYYLRKPAPADTLIYSAAARRPPRGPWDAPAILTDLSCLEALGDPLGAANAIEDYNFANPDLKRNPFQPLLNLRRLALLGSVRGFDAVKASIEQIGQTVTNADVKAYAADWLWLHAAPTNGLVAVYAHPEVEVFLDGASLGKVGSRESARLLRVPLARGRHQLTVACSERQREAWIHVAVLAGGKEVALSDGSWRFAHDPAAGWQGPDIDDARWTPRASLPFGSPGPVLPAYAVIPNPVPGLHSRALNINRGIPEGRTLTVYRKTFVVP